jgi:hypothetical protein
MEHCQSKTVWLKKLAKFIIQANQNTWAANAPKIPTQRSGYKELEYRSSDGLWLLRDSYTGYFRAPGMTTVYYKDHPVWTQAYGGQGMIEDQCDLTEPTFNFLKKALMNTQRRLPLRGPKEFVNNDWRYTFCMFGSLEVCTWVEKISKSGILLFTQTGIANLVIAKKETLEPLLPWEL